MINAIDIYKKVIPREQRQYKELDDLITKYIENSNPARDYVIYPKNLDINFGDYSSNIWNELRNSYMNMGWHFNVYYRSGYTGITEDYIAMSITNDVLDMIPEQLGIE